MKRTDKRLRFCILMIAVNLIFIWGNSMLNGEQSAAFSQWVSGLLNAIFPGGMDSAGTGHGLLRKLAHFSEFACLGGLLGWLLGMLGRSVPLALAGGFAAACVDETIQRFVPGRYGCLADVGIDTLGAAAGIGALILGYTILRKRRSKTAS